MKTLSQLKGILLLDKPGSLSSNALVQRVRAFYGRPKAGHGGTLDPMATGLMVLAIGEATKYLGMQLGERKSYLAHVLLGTRTDTEDITGSVLETTKAKISSKRLDEVLARYAGKMKQTPPSYSALKVAGRPLYRYAREGAPMQVMPREIEIFSLQKVRHHETELILKIDCSKGTYIRSLARDIGEDLGCGACLSGLKRLESGSFHLKDAVTLDALETMSLPERESCLLPTEALLSAYPSIMLPESEVSYLQQGQLIDLDEGLFSGDVGQILRAYGLQNQFVGLVEIVLKEIPLSAHGETVFLKKLAARRLLSYSS